MYYFLHYSKEINYIIYVTPKMDKDGVVWGKVIAFNDPNSVFKIGEEGFWFSKTDEDIKELFKDKKLHKVMEKYLIEIL